MQSEMWGGCAEEMWEDVQRPANMALPAWAPACAGRPYTLSATPSLLNPLCYTLSGGQHFSDGEWRICEGGWRAHGTGTARPQAERTGDACTRKRTALSADYTLMGIAFAKNLYFLAGLHIEPIVPKPI